MRRHDPDAPSKLRQHDPDVHTKTSHSDNDVGTTTEHEPREDPIPIIKIDNLYRQEQDRIDGLDDASRCERYGVEPLPDDQKNKRRIFFGTMLADENPEVIAAHAIEAYDKYAVLAFVESNTTYSATPRRLNYAPGSMNRRYLQESQMFGSKTKVVFDYWLEDMPQLMWMEREVEQRNSIWKLWVDHGMTERDVGILADIDEIPSRDFLNAVLVCDFPKLRYDPEIRPNCRMPKMSLSTIQFEASPLCIKKWEWFHPDMILGSCIAGVGDPSGRVIPERSLSVKGRDAKTLGYRSQDWGLWDPNRFPKDVIENDRYPLWDGRDFREVNGNDQPLINNVHATDLGHPETAAIGTAYHLHNWFTDMTTFRNKYYTYGHSIDSAMEDRLSELDTDTDLMVRCVHGHGNKYAWRWRDEGQYYENNTLLPEGEDEMFSLGGNRPIFFLNRTYIVERHALVKQMIRDDEAKYGTVYTNKEKLETREKRND